MYRMLKALFLKSEYLHEKKINQTMTSHLCHPNCFTFYKLRCEVRFTYEFHFKMKSDLLLSSQFFLTSSVSSTQFLYLRNIDKLYIHHCSCL